MPSKQNYSISERKLFLRIIDVIVVVASVVLASSFLDFYYFDALDAFAFSWLATLSFYLLFFGQVFELYNLKVSSSRYLVVRSLAMTIFFTTIFYVFTPVVAPVLPANRMQIIYLFVTLFFPLVVWRFLYISFIFLPKYHKYVLLIGDEHELPSLAELIQKKAPDNKIMGYLSKIEIPELSNYHHFNSTEESLSEIVEESFITDIVVAKSELSQSKMIHNELIHLFENGISILSAKKFIESITFLVPELEMKDTFYDYLTLSRNHQSRVYLTFIRLLDIVTALLGIGFITLILPIILVGNLLGNRGSLFYFQQRVGEGGENFTMIKFRTMIKNAEKNGAVWATKGDHRVTPFGSFLRQTRLDEMPQFLNILKGDMSLIGPRPERPEFVIDLQNKIPFYAIRHVIKPGLTGWAQVMHPYANTLEDYDLKVRYDLFYIKERNILLDFKIFIKTITTVLFFRGH